MPWTVTQQVPLSMRLPRQEHWSGLPFPLPGDLPNPGMEYLSPALQVDSLPLSHQTINSLNKDIGDWKLRSQRVTSIWKYWRSFYLGESCNIWLNFGITLLLLCFLLGSCSNFAYSLLVYFLFIYLNWRLITLQYCSEFCHTLTWISHSCTCDLHLEPPLPPPSPSHPSRSSQCTHRPWVPYLMYWTGLAIYFTYGNMHVSMQFPQIIPPSPSPTESKSLFFTSVSLLLSCI